MDKRIKCGYLFTFTKYKKQQQRRKKKLHDVQNVHVTYSLLFAYFFPVDSSSIAVWTCAVLCCLSLSLSHYFASQRSYDRHFGKWLIWLIEQFYFHNTTSNIIFESAHTYQDTDTFRHLGKSECDEWKEEEEERNRSKRAQVSAISMNKQTRQVYLTFDIIYIYLCIYPAYECSFFVCSCTRNIKKMKRSIEMKQICIVVDIKLWMEEIKVGSSHRNHFFILLRAVSICPDKHMLLSIFSNSIEFDCRKVIEIAHLFGHSIGVLVFCQWVLLRDLWNWSIDTARYQSTLRL